VIRSAAACGVLLLAGGCATLPPASDEASWPQRQAELRALQTWDLTGRVAVATAAEGFSGGLVWRQDGAQAEIDLRGPMGAAALSIRLDGANVTVTDADGTAVTGEAAREYIASQIGAPLPVEELRFWLLGVPAPGSPYQETFGTDGRLAGLDQSGWQLRYARYEAVGRFALPARIEIKSATTRLRLVISDRRLPP